ncbi:ER membrane protein complex subunit 3 isoform X1 [Protobothrops mucrosquamatus]|uniref:ER membrane protein complex subunit 3 isoform X1 n=1 Tax=Protobothrops mucrosquamatus TaxID=103944 RepID=UPI00077575D2|nr:ER membrane protein complex subunit 3 isoform X1 [Protobothrops mucrosquamatus]
MTVPDLRLDPSIRFWILLPVAWIALAVGILRLRVAKLLRGERQPAWPEQRQDTQILTRSRLLRENGRFLTHQGFLMRKHYFNNSESGFFRTTKRKLQSRNPLTDPTVVTEMMKGNLIDVLPMILIGGWINWAFSGFVATKVPFPLTLRFKPMLQRGINLPSMDPSWVSSASWYFLNVFGLRKIYQHVLREDSEPSQLKVQFMGPDIPAPPDPNKAFKAEWEALELVSHHWALQDVEEQLISQDLKLTGMSRPD